MRKVPLFCSLVLVFVGGGLPPGSPTGFHPGHAFDLTAAAFAEEAKKELPPCLADIAKATSIEDGRLKSARLKDSLLAAQKLGPSAREMLVEMAQTATPAGRLLAVALLRKIDAAEYQKQADALKQEIGEEKISYTSPSERCHYNVSDILSDQASKTPLIRLLPDISAK
jgi:hypothetical protein